jgi:ubiquinone biosynthesis protein
MLYGVFHGDLHGGNLFVMADGRVALLDHGITGRLDEPRRLAFLRLLMGGTINDLRVQLGALVDLGALPTDTDLEAVIADLNLEGPVKDPTKMTPDELVGELKELTKQLLAYGARMPKELMLFVKNLLFLNGSMAIMAPDVDILGEVMAIVTYFSETHGERIAREMGVQLSDIPIDLDGYRAAIGYVDPADRITFRELQERRDLIRQRMQDRHAGRHGVRSAIGSRIRRRRSRTSRHR